MESKDPVVEKSIINDKIDTAFGHLNTSLSLLREAREHLNGAEKAKLDKRMCELIRELTKSQKEFGFLREDLTR